MGSIREARGPRFRESDRIRELKNERAGHVESVPGPGEKDFGFPGLVWG